MNTHRVFGMLALLAFAGAVTSDALGVALL